MNLSEFIGLIIFGAIIAGVFMAWRYCMKRPKNCINWRFGPDRRVLQHPILFPCRRKNIRREDED